MTLKARNRLNFTMLIFSLAIFITTAMLLLIQLLRGSLSFEVFEEFKNEESNFLLRYSGISVISSVFAQLLFAVLSFYILLRAFTKTQAQNLLFFYLFLLGTILDCTRIFILLFNVSGTYSSLLIACGNICLFSNIIIPLSLLCTNITSEEDLKINIEQLLFSTILLSLFFASIIPLNTSKIMPNFTVDFSFKNVIYSLKIISYLLSIIILIVYNAKRKYKQLTAIGFTVMILGFSILKNSTNYLTLAIGVLLTYFGQFMYLKELHNQYLWND
ncbi:MAG: hypothetical protein K5829_15280 [Treponema sp.]|nr:hypothetical protein [Treponema sp.]